MALNTSLAKGLLTSFFEGFKGTPINYDKVATVIKSTARSENYGWIAGVPRMREMLGERQAKKLGEYSYTITNKTFESTIEVDVEDLMDEQTGQYAIQAKSIGEAARLFPDELVFQTLLPGGFDTTCYDGQYFFDTDHPVGETGTTQSNKGTAALDANSFQVARTALLTMQDDYGRPTFNANPDFLLVIPPALETTAKGIVELDILSNGSSNVNKGAARILVIPWLTDTTNWYLLNISGTMKPFIVQEREFRPLDALEEGSERNFWNRKNSYGTLWRGNAGYGLYQKAYGALVAG
jgi:phage major head subunit gpT-like protein